HTGRIPKRGEVLTIGAYQFEVLKATRKRIVSLKGRRLPG
ncbi:MAG: transporter associated domain-containing protein, partial [Candidatus Oleimicrobiaceae bacterium]